MVQSFALTQKRTLNKVSISIFLHPHEIDILYTYIHISLGVMQKVQDI